MLLCVNCEVTKIIVESPRGTVNGVNTNQLHASYHWSRPSTCICAAHYVVKIILVAQMR